MAHRGISHAQPNSDAIVRDANETGFGWVSLRSEYYTSRRHRLSKVYIEEERELGEQCQSDFTHMGSLGVTIGGSGARVCATC